ncbi:MAG: DUF692 family protein [Alphaproteobacteria bacterium]|nr:DUF692 family protein [Alphaproteobacteria bacterium]
MPFASVHKTPRPLGIGFSYLPAFPAEFYRTELLDFVEMTPEKLCRARWDGGFFKLDLVSEKIDTAQQACHDLPLVVHGIELSIGSAAGWNGGYLEMLDRFQERWPFRWHSEHLSYQTIPRDAGGATSIGTPLPLPGGMEAVQLVGERAREINRRYGVPFLLENPAHYLRELPYESPIGDEFDLMAAVTDHGECGQLLDLHNLYCNAINHGFDLSAALDRIALDRVSEIHVAGGRWESRFWVDAHDSLVPEPVWNLLAATLPRCPNLAGIVFELLDFFAPTVGVEAVTAELRRMQDVWHRFGPADGAARH